MEKGYIMLSSGHYTASEGMNTQQMWLPVLALHKIGTDKSQLWVEQASKEPYPSLLNHRLLRDSWEGQKVFSVVYPLLSPPISKDNSKVMVRQTAFVKYKELSNAVKKNDYRKGTCRKVEETERCRGERRENNQQNILHTCIQLSRKKFNKTMSPFLWTKVNIFTKGWIVIYHRYIIVTKILKNINFLAGIHFIFCLLPFRYF